MDYYRGILSVFDKYEVLVNRYQHNPDVVFTTSIIARHRECLDDYIRAGYPLENFYYNINNFYQSDLRAALRQTAAHLAVQRDIDALNIKKKNWFLVTVNFDDKEIKGKEPEIMRRAHSKICETTGLEIRSSVFEKHRKDKMGAIYHHHHIHYVLETDYAKSKVIQFIFQKVKNLGVQTKTFIDVSTNGTLQSALKYVSGDKRIEKLECVELDQKWRQENDLENI